MVSDYRAERERQEIAVEDGGFRDETWPTRIITFGRWLRMFSYEQEPEDDPRDEPGGDVPYRVENPDDPFDYVEFDDDSSVEYGAAPQAVRRLTPRAIAARSARRQIGEYDPDGLFDFRDTGMPWTVLSLTCAVCTVPLRMQGYGGDLVARQFAAYRKGWRQDPGQHGRHYCPEHVPAFVVEMFGTAAVSVPTRMP